MVRFSTPAINRPIGTEFDVVVTGNSFPTGLSGYSMEYLLTGRLELVNVTFPPAFVLNTHNSPVVTAVDLGNIILPGAVDVPIITLRLKIVGFGRTELSLNMLQLDDDQGFPIIATWNVGTIQITASRTDYKLPVIRRLDNDTTEIRVRFYEGEISTVNEKGPDGVLVPVIRYRRSGLVKRPLADFATLIGVTARLVEGGNAIIPTFNRHLTDDQLRTAMNAVLAKDVTRTAIDEQKNP